MSARKEKHFALASLDYDKKSSRELRVLSKNILQNGIHGLCFSPYMEGQKPGDLISEAQILRRLEIIRPFTKWIRTFSCTNGNEAILRMAKEFGIKTIAGARIRGNPMKNRREIENLLELAKEGYVDIAAVGNEVMYRGDITEDELLALIDQVQEALPNIQVGYADAYFEFTDRPRISEACDVILANCYPFWEGCDQDYSLMYLKNMYQIVLRAANGKKVIISETGWPNKGTRIQGAFPSYQNAMKYFMNSLKWSKEDAVELFFHSFDEAWKKGDEGDVGAYWGLWDVNEKLKYK